MEGPFAVVLLSEWMEDDVDHSELFFALVDFVIHSELLFARVLPIFGSKSHVLAEHMLVHVSRITESEQIPGRWDPFFDRGESNSDEECVSYPNQRVWSC